MYLRAVCGVLFCFMPFGMTLADTVVTETQPVEGVEMKDFRIMGCSKTSGVVAYNYYSFKKGGNLVISDFCLDEETGKFASAEVKEGFALVAKGRNGRKFEVPGSGKEEFNRYSISLTGDADGWACPVAKSDAYWFSLHTGQSKPSLHPDRKILSANGFTIGAVSGGINSNDYSNNHEFSFVPLTVDGQAPDTSNSGEAYLASFDGTSSISYKDGEGTLTFIEGDGERAGEIAGKLQIVGDAKGEVILRGDLAASNARLSGHLPEEWVTMEADVPYMRGQILGVDGSALYAYGIAVGSFVDASGKAHTFKAQVNLYGCFQ